MLLNLLFSGLMLVSFAQEKVEVKTFSPQGYVKSVQQIRIEFSKPMVAFGEIGLKSPAQSECFKNGQGRWVDTKNWVFDFNDVLSGGAVCEVKVLNHSYTFNTGGPHIKETFPVRYRGVDVNQNFVLMLDSPVKVDSIKKGLYFVVEGIGDRIPAEVLTGSAAKEVKEAAEKEYPYEKESFKGDYVIVKAQRSFAPGAKVSLVWSKEIQSASGAHSPEDEVLEFNVAEAFKADFSCDREAPEAPCIPLLSMRLTFSNPIKVSLAKEIFVEAADKSKQYAANLKSAADGDQVGFLEFKGPFKERSQYKLILPGSIKDEDGNVLTNISKFPLTVTTGENPSLLKFAADFGVIEAGPQAMLPVTLRRIEKNIPTSFNGWTGSLKSTSFKDIIEVLNLIQQSPTGDVRLGIFNKLQSQKIQINKPLKSAEMEVVGIPLKSPGFYAVEMESLLLGQSLLNKKSPFYVRSTALVTNMAVHIKYTTSEALVWVTDLNTARSVSNASVKIYDVKGREVIKGTTDSKGLAYFKFATTLDKWASSSGNYFNDGFFAVAEKGNDFSFSHSSWDRGIEKWRFQLGYADSESPFVGHAILDRNLLRPEETLSAKIILRKTNAVGFTFPKDNEWPATVVLNHDSGIQSFKIPLTWNKSKGFAVLNWKSPQGVKMGNWSMTLDMAGSSLPVGHFSIESFRVPLVQMRVTSTNPVSITEKNVPVQISANYFSGGPAANLPVKLRWSVEPSFFSPEDDDLLDFSFANGGVKEGLFRSGEDDIARHIPQSGSDNFNLNKQGSYEAQVNNLKYGLGPQRLRTEVEFKDPNGEIQNVYRSFAMWPSSVVMGIRSKSWWATPKKIEFETIALDLNQKPLKAQKIQVDLFTVRYYSHRKRLVGGFYAFEDFREIKKIGELCSGVTGADGKFSCFGSSKVAGSVLAVASTLDEKGRKSFANVNQWIVEPGESLWFGGEDHDRADLIPFKKSYEPGEVAEFQLRTPFPISQVLVTVERDSVLSTEVVQVKGDNPVIRVPIKKEYAPNVVVSAFAVRGRLGEPRPTALVDLGKPAFKLGMANIKVGWKENTLKVAVSTDRKTYRAKEKSQVLIQVIDSAGKPAKEAEVAIAAVDEGLLELKDNDSWNLLTSMMRPRAHTVNAATVQSLVIGKRHFGLKALPIGGDGGGAQRRELFDTLLYWNPTLKLDAKGEAKVEIPLNDSTTSFRFVAIATQGPQQFGTGWTSIQSSQELMILPGLSGVARAGDKFLAGFTVRNTSKEKQTLDVSLRLQPAQGEIKTQKVTLDPNEAKELHWSVLVPQNSDKLEYVITARNQQGRVVDEVKKTQKILPLRQAMVLQSEWGQWPTFKELSLQLPTGAELGKSSIAVEVNAELGGSLAGVNEFWKNYEYTCLEQQVSKAISLNDKKLWQKVEDKLTAYFDENGFVRYFPNANSKGSAVLTAYVLSAAHEAGFEFSEENENRMLGALQGFAEGRIKDFSEVSRVDDVLKKISAFEALSRYRKLNIDLLSSIEMNGNQWPLYSLVEWYQIHQWEKNISKRAEKIVAIENMLRNRFYFSAKRLQLRNEKLDAMTWLMRSSDSASLRLILATMNNPSWRQDVARLYQGALARRAAGQWQTTTDNTWGSLVTRKIQAVLAPEKVEGVFEASLDGKVASHKWNKNSTAGNFEFPWSSSSKIQWRQKGPGQPWVTVTAKASVSVTKPLFAGFNIEKTVTPVEQKIKGVWSVGDVAKVQLKVTTKAPQTWVVIEDPIPAGATILQASYATAIERKEDLIRFYHSWFSETESTMDYTVRFNQPGTYQVPVTRVEAMYSPDIFAVLPESTWTVKE